MLTLERGYALLFGALLGLAIWKYGNPVILDQQITAPASSAEWLNEAWPIHWAGWTLLPVALAGLFLSLRPPAGPGGTPRSRWLIALPLVWLGWQFVSAVTTVDPELTRATLWEFAGCAACYFLARRLFARPAIWPWLLPGLFAGLIWCLIRAVDQHIYEYPASYEALVAGEHCGWTNFTAASFADLQANHLVIATNNGALVANPVFLKKFAQGRVSGTLVYPNALAQLLLLCGPLALSLAGSATRTLKPAVRGAVMVLSGFLTGAAFYFTGSKLGWLIALGVIGLYLLRRDWPRTLKIGAVAVILAGGLAGFGLRFHHYLANGATSVSARFDYWRAAVQTTAAEPLTGTGPGTFQRPYSRLKSPTAEMARLTHNDYLEQFCDSGLPGGLAYATWIALALFLAARRQGNTSDPAAFALLVGLAAWFTQGLGEFGLYIPALAWPAFTALGILTALPLAKSATKPVTR